MSRATDWLAYVTIDNSFNLMEALDEVVLIPSIDAAKVDPEVWCQHTEKGSRYSCATYLCDAEAHDSLAELVLAAVTHYEKHHQED